MSVPILPTVPDAPDSPDSPTVQSRRSMCASCLRPASACICRWVRPLATAVELLILQHPLEVNNAKGSARLLHMSLPGSVMVTGEQFDPVQLAALLHADGRRPVLLYPDSPGVISAPVPAVEPAALRLVVLDGTWRKSRKMLHLNSLLLALPRLPLRAVPATHYRIRKAHAPNQLSTLEASCYALAQLEQAPELAHPLLAAFDEFVDVFLAHSGRLGSNAA